MASVMKPPKEGQAISATKLLINNRWVASESGQTFTTVNPAKRQFDLLADLLVPRQHTCTKCGATFTTKCRKTRWCPGCRPKVRAEREKRRHEAKKRLAVSGFALLVLGGASSVV
jgi:hypothetical protein